MPRSTPSSHAMPATPPPARTRARFTAAILALAAGTLTEYPRDRTIDTITEAEVGATAWHQAIDHGFFIILDLAMGGNYPDGECNCTAPTAATTSGGTMRLAYVTVYERGGHAQPAPKPTATGQLTGFRHRCLSNSGSLNTEGNPMFARSCTGRAGQRWSVYPGRTLRTEGGCLDVAGRRKGQRHAGRLVPVQRHGGPGLDPRGQRRAGEPGFRPVPHRSRRRPRSSRLDIETCTGSAAQRWSLPRR